MKTPDLVIASDLHIRETTPICRIDDYIATEFRKLDFIFNKTFPGVPHIVAGDIFHHWKQSPEILAKVIKLLMGDADWTTIYTIPGQHDLPEHRLDNVERSAYEVLKAAKVINNLYEEEFEKIPTITKRMPISVFGFPWGFPITEPPNNPEKRRQVACSHQLVYKGRPPFPGCEGNRGNALLKKHPEYDLIITGDNHQSFHIEYQGRLLINPGSIKRDSADQIDFQPRIALWYTKDNSVKWIDIPIEENCISTEHIDEQVMKEKRKSAFVERLKTGKEIGLTFIDNLKIILAQNKVKEEVKDLIWRSLD